MRPFTARLNPTVVIPAKNVADLPDYCPWEKASLSINGNALQWMPREEAERSDRYVQIIPSAIISSEPGVYHTFRRCPSPIPELSDKTSIIIGGHCDITDIQPNSTIQDIEQADPSLLAKLAADFSTVFSNAMLRELYEEVSCLATPPRQPICTVYDRSTEKTAQHLALIFPITCTRRLRANAPEEFVDDPELNGKLVSTRRLARQPDRLDPWTRLIIEANIKPKAQ